MSNNKNRRWSDRSIFEISFLNRSSEINQKSLDAMQILSR